MKKIIVAVLIVYMFISNNVYALSLSCRSCILMDMDSNRILYEKNIDEQRLIASITKIMTAIIAIESGKLNEKVVVGNEVLKMYGSNIYIEVGEEMILKDLIYGLMLRSGNDAAVVIATYISGDETKFVEEMNKKARKIGMKNTVFNNCHGLDEDTQNKSTAYDMALLSSYAFKNPIYRKIVNTKKYKVKTNKKSYDWTNRNKLLFSYKYAIGGKTGYTPSAGRTLVTNASNNGLNLTAVTLDDGNEYISHEKMYEYAFNNYKVYKILDKNKFKIDDYYFKNKVYIKNDFSYPLKESEKDHIKVQVKLNLKTEYNDNEEVGIVSVKLYDEEIYADKVYVKIKKEKNKNILVRIKNKIFGK